VATTSLTYTVPTSFPSGQAGSLYKVSVTVKDQVQHTTTAESARPFYVVRPDPTAKKTLILWDSARLGNPAGLAEKLEDLAANPLVQGLVVDVSNNTAINALYATWDASPANTSLANEVLFAPTGIHELILTLHRAYAGIKYLVIVGDDTVIPFARLADPTGLQSESNYPDGSNLTATGTSVGRALKANAFLSDDPLAVLDSFRPTDLNNTLFVPDLAVGRLVESGADISTAIATFISKEGAVDVGGASDKVLVTGYDFLTDVARQIGARWTAAYDAASVDKTRIGSGWPGSVAANVDSLKTAFCQQWPLASLSGHAAHFEEGVPGTDASDIQGLGAAVLDGPNACGAGTPLNLSGAVLYAVGCHGGLSVSDASSDPNDHELDLPQTFLSHGAGAYVANTGYGWGLKYGIGYGERLEQLLTEELTRGGTIPIGDAVKAAKRRYYLETPRYDAYDQKSLMQWTLFGLPMYAVNTGLTPGGRPSLVSGVAPRAEERPGYETMGGVAVERSLAATASLPSYLTRLDLHFDLTASGVYSKWTADGDPAGDCSNGCYYTLNGLVDRATGAGDLPLQPYLIYDSRLAGTSQHGVLWKGGVYVEDTNFTPVFAQLTTNYVVGDPGSTPRLMFTRPTSARLVPGVDPSLCRPSDLELNSLTVSAGEALKSQDADPVYKIERTYRSIDLEALYFNNTLDPLKNCDRDGPAIGPGPFGGAYHQVSGSSIEWAVPVTDVAPPGITPAGVWRVLVVVNDGSVDVNQQGTWAPVELTNNGGTWTGSQAFGAVPRVTYVIQAVDKAGNVTWVDYIATQLPTSGVSLGVPLPVDVLIGPPVGPAIQGFTPARGPVGLTVRIGGANLAGATQVSFGGVPAVIAANTGTLITTSVPLGAVTGPIAAVTPAGTATSAASFGVTPPGALSITDVRVREGNSGQRNAVFRVTLSAPSTQIVTVNYATSNGTATAGSDYVPMSGTLTFRPFARARTVNVPVLGDTTIEGNETFLVTLTNPSNAAIARGQGRGTIVDDDR
jgi:hypothetical protein